MCGIICIINKTNLNNTDLIELEKSLYNRGPDDFNYVKYKNITLAHSILSIQNFTDIGKQPYEYNNSLLIYNGEIYNCEELKKKYDIEFNLDTDLIIKLYSKYKNIFFTKIISEFDGIFSFCILDKTIEKLYVVRDMLGVKPLYFFENSEYFAISSTMKSFDSLIEFKINNNNLYEFWNFRQCLNNNTIIDNIFSFQSAHFYEYELNGKLIFNKMYTSIFENKQEYTMNLLETKLNNAMNNNLISDKNIKIGCFLSGGIDSSYIYNYCKNIKDDIYSYSIGFENCNEFEYVNKLITDNDKHKNLVVTVDEYFENMIYLINDKGNLLHFPNEVLISLISKEARKDGLKVLISGEGADELFHGYGRIFNLFLNQDKDFIKSFIKEYRYCKNNNLFNFDYDDNKFYDFFSKFNSDDMHKQDIISNIFLNFHIEGLTNRLCSGSMRHSIEARVPFLNQSLVKYVFNSVPRTEKIKRNYDENKKYTNFKELSENNDIPKYCLKKIAENILPNEIIYRKKVDFVVPIEDINNKFIRNLIFKIISKGFTFKYKFLNKDFIINEVLNKSKDLKYIIFYLINIEIFIQLFIEKINIDSVKQFILDTTFTVGYTCGVYDLFHVGHLNILKKAKEQCDFLIVAVTTDEKVSYKGKTAVINENDRKEIVNGCQYVDTTIFQTNHDKFNAWKELNYDVLIVGDDWKGHENWIKWEKQLNEVGARVHYEPYTKGVSSSELRNKLKK